MHQFKQSAYTAYTDACKTYWTKPVYTTVFLNMNPRFRTM